MNHKERGETGNYRKISDWIAIEIQLFPRRAIITIAILWAYDSTKLMTAIFDSFHLWGWGDWIQELFLEGSWNCSGWLSSQFSLLVIVFFFMLFGPQRKRRRRISSATAIVYVIFKARLVLFSCLSCVLCSYLADFINCTCFSIPCLRNNAPSLCLPLHGRLLVSSLGSTALQSDWTLLLSKILRNIAPRCGI